MVESRGKIKWCCCFNKCLNPIFDSRNIGERLAEQYDISFHKTSHKVSNRSNMPSHDNTGDDFDVHDLTGRLSIHSKNT